MYLRERHYNAKPAVGNICPIQAQHQHRSLDYKERKARASHGTIEKHLEKTVIVSKQHRQLELAKVPYCLACMKAETAFLNDN